jgi:hypothetical protein
MAEVGQQTNVKSKPIASAVVEREVSTLLTELAEMSRQISSQLDARAARLEELIRQADVRIERLSAMHSGESDRSGPDPIVERQNTAENDANFDVYKLADEGCTAQQIAARLDRPKGEIELILALRSRS